MMRNPPNKQNISIHQVIAALLDDQNIFPAAYLHQFSDLDGTNLEALRTVWPQVSRQRRINLLGDLEELSEADTLVSFDSVSRMALKDEEPRVRTIAIRLLWENKDPRLPATYMDMLQNDPDVNVRAAAAYALGSYVYLGEVEEISPELHHQVEDVLIATFSGQDAALVRLRVLESLGFSGRKEVTGLIREAYNSEDIQWLISALFAMGRSADTVWGPEVTRMLRHQQTTVQAEAIRAAGELGLESARRTILQILDEDLQDVEVRSAAIWALSQIGGDEVRETLDTLLEEAEDEDEIQILEDALDNLSFNEEVGLFGLFDFLDNAEEVDDYISGLEGDEESKPGEESSSRGSQPGSKSHRHRKH